MKKSQLKTFMNNKSSWRKFMMYLVSNLFPQAIEDLFEGNMMYLADEVGINMSTGKKKPGRPRKK